MCSGVRSSLKIIFLHQIFPLPSKLKKLLHFTKLGSSEACLSNCAHLKLVSSGTRPLDTFITFFHTELKANKSNKHMTTQSEYFESSNGILSDSYKHFEVGRPLVRHPANLAFETFLLSSPPEAFTLWGASSRAPSLSQQHQKEGKEGQETPPGGHQGGHHHQLGCPGRAFQGGHHLLCGPSPPRVTEFWPHFDSSSNFLGGFLESRPPPANHQNSLPWLLFSALKYNSCQHWQNPVYILIWGNRLFLNKTFKIVFRVRSESRTDLIALWRSK